MSQNYQLNSGIEKAVYKQFQRVSTGTILGLVGRILETDDFVAVVDGSDHCIGVITHVDLLYFASHSGPGKGVGNANHTNGN